MLSQISSRGYQFKDIPVELPPERGRNKALLYQVAERRIFHGRHARHFRRRQPDEGVDAAKRVADVALKDLADGATFLVHAANDLVQDPSTREGVVLAPVEFPFAVSVE